MGTIWRQSIAGGKSHCKGPEVGTSGQCWRYIKEASLSGVMDLGRFRKQSPTVLLCPIWEEGTWESNHRGWALSGPTPSGKDKWCRAPILTRPGVTYVP